MKESEARDIGVEADTPEANDDEEGTGGFDSTTTLSKFIERMKQEKLEQTAKRRKEEVALVAAKSHGDLLSTVPMAASQSHLKGKHHMATAVPPLFVDQVLSLSSPSNGNDTFKQTETQNATGDVSTTGEDAISNDAENAKSSGGEHGKSKSDQCKVKESTPGSNAAASFAPNNKSSTSNTEGVDEPTTSRNPNASCLPVSEEAIHLQEGARIAKESQDIQKELVTSSQTHDKEENNLPISMNPNIADEVQEYSHQEELGTDLSYNGLAREHVVSAFRPFSKSNVYNSHYPGNSTMASGGGFVPSQSDSALNLDDGNVVEIQRDFESIMNNLTGDYETNSSKDDEGSIASIANSAHGRLGEEIANVMLNQEFTTERGFSVEWCNDGRESFLPYDFIIEYLGDRNGDMPKKRFLEVKTRVSERDSISQWFISPSEINCASTIAASTEATFSCLLLHLDYSTEGSGYRIQKIYFVDDLMAVNSKVKFIIHLGTM